MGLFIVSQPFKESYMKELVLKSCEELTKLSEIVHSRKPHMLYLHMDTNTNFLFLCKQLIVSAISRPQ